MSDTLTETPVLRALARVCREQRRKREITQAAVAERAGMSRQAIVEFEAARAWPRDPERIVAAYDDHHHLLWQLAANRAAKETEGNQ